MINFITENGLDIYAGVVIGISLILALFFTWRIFKDAANPPEEDKKDYDD